MIVDDQAAGEVIWRRESSGGARDYQVRTAAGEGWFPESSLQAQ